MVRPNYNLIRFIRRCILQLKKEYGGPATVYKIVSADTNLETGVKTVSKNSVYVPRIVVLPNRLTREAIQSISAISANKKVVQGGTFDPGTRTFIIDRRDVPGWDLIQDDWIVYNNKRYDVKSIEEFEQETAWLVVAREVERMVPDEDHNVVANSYLLTLNSEVTYFMAQRVLLNVASEFGVSDTAEYLLNSTHSKSPSSTLNLTDSASGALGVWLDGTTSSALGISDTVATGSAAVACPSLDWTQVAASNWAGYASYLNANINQTGTDSISSDGVDSLVYSQGTILHTDGLTLVGTPATSVIPAYNVDTGVLTTVGTINATSSKWLSGVLGHDGKIYLSPSGTGNVAEVDVTANTVTLKAGSANSAPRYWSSALSAAGNMYCIPYNTSNYAVFSPTANTFTVYSTPALSQSAYRCSVLAPNGHIYCAPYRADYVMKINTSTNVATLIGALYSGTTKWRNLVVAQNGMLYGIPGVTTLGILKINPSTDAVSVFGTFAVAPNCSGGILAPNGFIYSFKYGNPLVLLKIDPSTDTYSEISTGFSATLVSSAKLCADGLIHGALGDGPNYTYFTLDPDSDVILCDNVVKAAYWNNT